MLLASWLVFPGTSSATQHFCQPSPPRFGYWTSGTHSSGGTVWRAVSHLGTKTGGGRSYLVSLRLVYANHPYSGGTGTRPGPGSSTANIAANDPQAVNLPIHNQIGWQYAIKSDAPANLGCKLIMQRTAMWDHHIPLATGVPVAQARPSSRMCSTSLEVTTQRCPGGSGSDIDRCLGPAAWATGAADVSADHSAGELETGNVRYAVRGSPLES